MKSSLTLITALCLSSPYMCLFCIFFFFSSRRRHTRYWRDWSSDVCSSDLVTVFRLDRDPLDGEACDQQPLRRDDGGRPGALVPVGRPAADGGDALGERRRQIGRASCRERG